MSLIYIVPIWGEESFSLEFLRVKISDIFKRKTTVMEQSRIDLMAAFNASRRQFNSSLLLLQLLNHHPRDAFRILGVTDVDLFIPILTFVFGEAQLNGPAAIVSCHRLDNRFYGLPENKVVLQERLIKEAVHELGHTYGLVHCLAPGCVMNSSTYVEDIDLKTERFCPSCIRSLKL